WLMRDLFVGRGFLLSSRARQFEEECGGAYQVRVETVSAHVETLDFPSAYAIAEFMLNLLPIPDPPARHALEDYVRARFERPDGSFEFSCDQDFVQIWRRGCRVVRALRSARYDTLQSLKCHRGKGTMQ